MKVEYPFPLSELKIVLNRHGCYGPCPVYKIEVLGTGKVIYHGEYFVKVKGEQTSQIPKKDVFKLFKYAQQIGFFDLRSQYVNKVEYELDRNNIINKHEYEITDLEGSTVEIHMGTKKKKVYDYLGAPARLRRFENMIDRVCQIDKWIGTEEERSKNLY